MTAEYGSDLMNNRLTLTIDEAAEMLGVSRDTVYRAVRAGQIPTLKLGARRLVIPRAAFERMLEQAGEPQVRAERPFRVGITA